MKVLTGSKHCWNQHGTTITLFRRQFKVKVGKSYLQSDTELPIKSHLQSRSKKKDEILRLFVNALTADDKYSGSNMQNLSQQFQTPAFFLNCISENEI